MRRRALGAVLAASTALLLVPAGSSADEVDTTCKNGNDPVVYTLVEENPVVRAQVRVLCIGED